MNKKRMIVGLSVLLLITVLVTTFLYRPSTTYAETMFIDFERGSIVGTEEEYYLPFKEREMKLDLKSDLPIKGYKIWMDDGTGKEVEITSQVNRNGDVLTFNAKGVAKTFYGDRDNNPGHKIYRDPNGIQWGHGIERAILFQPDQSTIKNGVSEYPGVIPPTGVWQDNGKPIDKYPTNLRYQYNFTDDGLPDYAPNYNMVGAAVTFSVESDPPDIFYSVKDDKKSLKINLDKIDPNSIEIKKARSSNLHPKAEPFYWGKSHIPGYGAVKVRLMLDNTLKEGKDYLVDYRDGKQELRNYLMAVNTEWEGTSYFYKGKIEIIYDLAKPDLGSLDFKTLVDCIGLNVDTPFEISFSNRGKAIDTPFTVQVWVAGQLHKTFNYPKMGTNQTIKEQFTYKFTNERSTEFVIKLDPDNRIVEETKANNEIKKLYAASRHCDDKPIEEKEITGDFEIIPGKIQFRDSFTLKPKNIVVKGTGCEYVSHRFRYNQNGWGVGDTPKVFSKTQEFKQNYPYNLQVGTVQVYMQIQTTCGNSDWIGPKPLEIETNPDNRPPVFSIGWFQQGDYYGFIPSATIVVKDSYVNLRVIKNPTTNPPEPYDPDGDPIEYYFHFEDSKSSWIRGLPDYYRLWPGNTEFNNLKATELGTHEIMATATDPQGASSTSKAMITVVEPNPIPIITAPDSVVEGRPVKPPIHGENSFTYVPGRTISKHFWENRRDVYPKPGIETITLEVEDNTGLRSLPENKAIHKLVVKEDLPPVPKLAYNSIGLRNTPLPIKNETYSPDGDAIVVNDLYVAYDSNNDGKCNEADFRKIGSGGGVVNYTADKVGKYCLKVYAEEDWGKHATGYFSFEIVNQAPEVSFTPVGISTEPEPIESTVYPASDFMTNKWVNTSLDQNNLLKYWSAAPDGTLVTVPMIRNTPNTIYDRYPDYPYETLPVSPNKVTGSKDLRKPAGNTFSLEYPLGGGKYIGRNISSGRTYRYYLVDTNGSKPELLFENEGVALYVREDLGELMFYYEQLLNLSNGENLFWRHYKLYKISELARGNTTPLDASTQDIRWYDWKYTVSGRALTFSDGSDPRKNTRLVKFNTDIKEIDLTNRKVYSYRYDNLTTPYKVESYTGIPAKSREMEGYDNHPDYGPKYLKASDLSRMDFKGNKYQIIEEYLQSTNKYADYLVRWDGNTGKPEIVHTFMGDYHDWVKIEFESDSRYINLAVGPSWNKEYWYYDAVSGNVLKGDRRIPYTPGLYRNSVNGIGILRKEIRDPYDDELMGYTFELADNKSKRSLGELPFRSGRYEDGYAQLIGGEIYFADDSKIFTYNYEGEQPPDHNEWHTNGQLIHTQMAPMTNGTIAWSQKVAYQEKGYLPTGVSFRIQDHKNMYRVEVTSSKVKLLKIVNGRKQVLREVTHFIPDNTWTGYKVDMRGSSLKVYENGVPVIEVTDSTFTRGTFGPYSVHDTVAFKGISSRMMPAGSESEVNGYAIVDTQVTYDTTYSDFENDPKIPDKTEWKTEHINTTMFLNIGDGKSGLSAFHNSVRKTPVPVFDKVGMYRISYREMDDPHPQYRYPSNVFGQYRKYSDVDIKTLIVHRRPIANFTASINNNNLVVWNERSYDPDRCYSFGNCQAAYAGNHGIYQKKYYYVTPSGQTVQGKLQRPTEEGVYTLGLAVADEYRAWSDWYEQDIVVKQPVAANRPPSVTLTYPNGSKANPTYVSTLTPTIKWNQSDPDPGTVFELFDVQIKDEWGRIFLKRTGLVQSTTATSNQWTLDVPLEQGQKYEVQVRVTDGQDYSPWSNIGWMITNRPPAAQMIVPNGTKDMPTMMDTLRPTLQWKQTDPDPGTVFKAYQLQIMDEAGKVILDTGEKSQNTSNTSASWTVDRDLPPRQKLQVHVRVHDGHIWSPWSPVAWMMINRPPVADFDWSPKPVWEGDPAEVFSLATDPDGDTLTYLWQVEGPDGKRSTFDTPRFNQRWLQPGRVVVKLTVSDGLASDSITKTIQVQELTIRSEVHHTPEWLVRHEEKEHNTTVPPKDFYSGEVFVVQTESSPAPVREASASLQANGRDGSPISITARLEPDESGVLFHGELYDERLGSLEGGLPKGFHHIRFKIIYDNGVVKEEEVPIRIIGSIYDYIGVHRIQ
ncbi:PKD domain-containing protein [Paenibacillus sp. SAFN-117]|uniref:glycoside hydrolase family 78 protein n=1 Tax=Paenibacillus sp. SAFN-117 TaxID=3436860 RepID=UPI003F80E312